MVNIASKIVKGGLEAIAKKLPRKSKAVLEAEGYYHPIGGGLKLSKPALVTTFGQFCGQLKQHRDTNTSALSWL